MPADRTAYYLKARAVAGHVESPGFMDFALAAQVLREYTVTGEKEALRVQEFLEDLKGTIHRTLERKGGRRTNHGT